MSDAPSPYAPGIISDQAAPPRPAGRPIVFLVATFAMTIATSATLWYSWVRASILISGHGNVTLGTLALFGMVPNLLVPLWAYLTDAIPLWGTRREGYLLLTGVMTAIVWLALAVAGSHAVTWMAGAALLATTGAVSYAAIFGALAEIGRRRAATGRLAAAQAGLAQLAAFAMSPLLVSSGFTSIWLVVGLAAGLALAVVLLAAISPADGDAQPTAAVAPPAGVPAFLRSRAFWASFAVAACAGLTTVPGGLLSRRMHAASANPSAWWVVGAVQGAAFITVVGYLLVCGRVRFATLLRLALLVSALAPAAQALASRGEDDGVIHFLAIANGATGTLMLIALQDLAMRAAPRGREAFGAVLLLGLSTLFTRLGGSLGSLDVPAAAVAWVAAGAAIVGAIAVSLLPATVTEFREGRVIGSAP